MSESINKVDNSLQEQEQQADHKVNSQANENLRAVEGESNVTKAIPSGEINSVEENFNTQNNNYVQQVINKPETRGSKLSRHTGNSSKVRKKKNSKSKTVSKVYDPQTSYTSATSMYTSPRKFNRHAFGLGNNLRDDDLNISKELVKEKYTTIQDTTSLKSGLPQKKFSFDQNVRGSLQSNQNGQDRYKDAKKTDNQPSLEQEFSQDLIDQSASTQVQLKGSVQGLNAKSLDKIDRRSQDNQVKEQYNRNSMGALDDKLFATLPVNTIKQSQGRNRSNQISQSINSSMIGVDPNMSPLAQKMQLAINKQLSAITMGVIKQIQSKNPSRKFHAKIIEKEKEMERRMVENRVAKLEFENRKAQKQLNATIKAHQKADEIAKRKMDDLQAKMNWMRDKAENLQRQKELNTRLREERKSNIAAGRQQVMMQNIIARDRQIQEMNHQNEIYNQEATQRFMEMSMRTAGIYRDKRAAKEKAMNDFQNNLLKVRTSCEDRARNSIFMSEAHQNRIQILEHRERQYLDSLQSTVKQNCHLISDLSKKSETLTNQLIPRNPIAPKNKKYPVHSEFGFSVNNRTVKQKYDDLVMNAQLSSTDNAGAFSTYNRRSTGKNNTQLDKLSMRSPPFKGQKRSVTNDAHFVGSDGSTNYDTRYNTKNMDFNGTAKNSSGVSRNLQSGNKTEQPMKDTMKENQPMDESQSIQMEGGSPSGMISTKSLTKDGSVLITESQLEMKHINLRYRSALDQY